jgi:hypothetical protein
MHVRTILIVVDTKKRCCTKMQIAKLGNTRTHRRKPSSNWARAGSISAERLQTQRHCTPAISTIRSKTRLVELSSMVVPPDVQPKPPPAACSYPLRPVPTGCLSCAASYGAANPLALIHCFTPSPNLLSKSKRLYGSFLSFRKSLFTSASGSRRAAKNQLHFGGKTLVATDE